jgi:hypothetical protein
LVQSLFHYLSSPGIFFLIPELTWQDVLNLKFMKHNGSDLCFVAPFECPGLIKSPVG